MRWRALLGGEKKVVKSGAESSHRVLQGQEEPA